MPKRRRLPIFKTQFFFHFYPKPLSLTSTEISTKEKSSGFSLETRPSSTVFSGRKNSQHLELPKNTQIHSPDSSEHGSGVGFARNRIGRPRSIPLTYDWKPQSYLRNLSRWKPKIRTPLCLVVFLVSKVSVKGLGGLLGFGLRVCACLGAEFRFRVSWRGHWLDYHLLDNRLMLKSFFLGLGDEKFEPRFGVLFWVL